MLGLINKWVMIGVRRVKVALCYGAQLLRIILHVNKRPKLRTLTLIHPVVNPNIHELTYCHNLIHFEHPNLSVSGSASPGFLQTLKKKLA